MSNKNGAFLKESKNFSFRLTPPSALCPSPSNLEKTFPDFAPLRPVQDWPQVNHKVGGRRAEGGERQSQGKFFPGWRDKVGGRRRTKREVLTSLQERPQKCLNWQLLLNICCQKVLFKMPKKCIVVITPIKNIECKAFIKSTSPRGSICAKKVLED